MIDTRVIVVLVLFSPLIIGVFMLLYEYIMEFKKIYSVNKKDSLILYLEELSNDSVGNNTKYLMRNIEDILILFKEKRDRYIYIGCHYNEKNYPLYKIYNKKDLMTFKKCFYDTPYVIFNHHNQYYSCIIDQEYKKIEDIFKDVNWLTINQYNDRKSIMYHNKLFIDGLYEYDNFKPTILETNGNLSENFKNFINKLVDYYDNQGLELSVLKYQNSEMIIRYNRQKKLKQLSIINDTTDNIN